MSTHRMLFTTNRLGIIDAAVACVTMTASFEFRFDIGPALAYFMPQLILAALVAVAVKPAVYYLAGLYRIHWACVGLREVLLSGTAVTAASLTVAVITAAAHGVGIVGPYPISVFVLDWIVTLASIGLLRALVHYDLKARETTIKTESLS